MDCDFSQQQGLFIHPHPSTTQPFDPSGPVPLPHSIAVADLSAPPLQDTAQTMPLPHPSSSALPAENILFYNMVPETTLSFCPWGYRRCPGHDWCRVLHPLQSSIDYGSMNHSISDKTLFTSTQGTFYQQHLQANPPAGANIYSYEYTMRCLLPSERFIFEERLKDTTWENILREYNRRWTPVSHDTALMKRLQNLRKKYPVINHILPSRTGTTERSGHTHAVGIPCPSCGL